ncbi:transglutaminase-like domain-containing protein [Zafaria sp. Z1313]|uniref:transglutaminase-like domain-containing protein n=1 Tax=unclassified Zafaria TaxID=2828765 RepID=UPI002E7917E9|nr:transglutaminase-like domain-containing protein [Zafaria sp. J156]MEE1620001.1 transglutaminase-like domain-containing protein [Zafaria sp. J156]
MSAPTRPLRRQLVDAACLFAALALGILGLHEAFGGNPYYLAAGLGGALAGLGIALANVRLRLGILTTAGLALAAYLLLGTPLAAPREAIAGFVPSLDALRTLLAGIVLSWKDVLTVSPPVGIQGGMLVVPFLTALVTGLAAGLTAWRLRSAFWVVIPVSVAFVVGIAFGTHAVPLPLVRGILMTVLMVSWLAWRRHVDRSAGPALRSLNHGEEDVHGARDGMLRRIAFGAVVLVVAAGTTAVAAPLLDDRDDRRVLRDIVVPPVDLYDYPSPLMKFRSYVKDNAEQTLLTVTGLPDGERIRLAALDSYDGMVLNVDPRSGGNFSPVGDATSVASTAAVDDGRATGTLGIEIGAYSGVWVPGGGRLDGLELEGERTDQLARSLYYNAEAETALSTIPLQDGDRYTAHVAFPARPGDDELAERGFAPLRMPRLANVPPAAGGKGAEFAASGTNPLERARAIEAVLANSGYFSNGKENEVPSLSGHGAARIAALLDAEDMIGDDEQYAVAMALMAREQGMPARVVMGFYPERYNPGGEVALTGADAHAWVEIAFEGSGWVAFDPTPDKDKEPTPPQQEPQSVPQPQVLQPPPPPQDPARLPPETAPDPQDAEEEERGFWDVWGPLITLIGVALVPLVALLIPLLFIAWLKLRRRRGRFSQAAPGVRVGGGWSEVLSLATDLGARPDARGTRRENARALGADFPQTSGTVLLLAGRADGAVFGTTEPSEAQVADYWNLVDEQLDGMRSSVGFWKRQRARFSPRSLFQDAAAGIVARRKARGGNAAGPADAPSVKE